MKPEDHCQKQRRHFRAAAALFFLSLNIQVRRHLVIVAGVGGIAGDMAAGDHVHLQEGAEHIGVVVQNGLLQPDGQLTPAGGVELSGSRLTIPVTSALSYLPKL